MTREERKLYIKSFYAPLFYGNLEHLVDEVYGDFEAQLKAKDEEIGKLTYAYIAELQRVGKKAHSIVAMLFWMMKRQKAIYVKSFNELGINNHNTSFYKGAYEDSKMRFKQAYKILKDNK